MAEHGHPDNWQKIFSVTDYIQRKKSTGLFKITSVVFPKSHPEASTKITVWKHYDDIGKLHKALKRKSKLLRISEPFPTFEYKKYYKRFSDEDIKCQKNDILRVLSFVSKHPVLFMSEVCVAFFQSGYFVTDIDVRDYEPRTSSEEGPSPLSDVMGQVLPSEGSQSSDESQASERSQSKKKSLTVSNFINMKKTKRNAYSENENEMPFYWEEAAAHAREAHQQEMCGNYEIAFAMYKAAIVSLLSGVQGDVNSEHRAKVKEKTSQYLMRAEWIYSNYLVFRADSAPENISRLPFRPRSQMKRYKVIDIIQNNLLVQDVVDENLVVIKGVLKSSCPLDRSDRLILPNDVPYMVKLLGVHETETTVFLVLEHVRYGRLWDHLEHYFCPGIICDNADSEITYMDSGNYDDSDSLSSCSLNSYDNSSLSRLESSIYTDTLSCESLSSHDENYFDLIEDYAKAKNKKLREIQDSNERRKHMEAVRSVKKTTSQIDLKSLDDDSLYRSHSMTELSAANLDIEETTVIENGSDDVCYLNNEIDDTDFQDIDTQKLLKNAKKLIDSINETLSKNIRNEQEIPDDSVSKEVDNGSGVKSDEESIKNVDSDDVAGVTYNNLMEEIDYPIEMLPHRIFEERKDDACSPISESVPSVTEEYSATAIFQRNSLTYETVKKWAAQLLLALDTLHQNGIVCRDFNPENILLADDGSIKLTYFYRYPNVDPSFNYAAYERLYGAPEVDPYTCANFASDWWSYGAVLYELITLKPLYECHPGGIDDRTSIHVSEKIPPEARSLLRQLLRFNADERLGSGISGVENIKSHPFFSGIDWEQM